MLDPLDVSVSPRPRLWDTSRVPPAADEIREELRRVLASSAFVNAARLSRFLKFVVEQSLAGNGERLKEYVIGVEVFDRDPQYDPRVDSIVRVEAGRVRSKLDEYYNGAGKLAAVGIRLPKGSYSAVFERLAAPAAERANGAASTSSPVGVPSEQPVAAATSAARSWPRPRVAIALVVAGALLLAAVAGAWWLAPRAPDAGPAVAVLPFTPYSTADADRVAATRLTDAVTAELVRLDLVDVVSSTRAREFAEARGTAADAARDLGADFLLEARLLGEAGGLRVEMRLVDGSSSYKLAVETLRGEAADIDELARRVAAAAAAALAPHLPAPRGEPSS